MNQLILLGALVLSAVHFSPALAQEDPDEEARSLYNAGASAFQDGRFEVALERWEEAYALRPLPALRYNLATAHDRLGQLEQARTEYRAYLEALPDAENANYVERRLTVIEEMIARQSPTETPTVDPPDTDLVVVEPDPSMDPLESEESEESSSAPNIGAIVVMSAGGAALIGGVVLAIVAGGRYSDLESACPGGICREDQQSDIDSLRTTALTADILMAVGGAALIGGVVWMLVGGDDEPEDSASLRFDVGISGASLSGRF